MKIETFSELFLLPEYNVVALRETKVKRHAETVGQRSGRQIEFDWQHSAAHQYIQRHRICPRAFPNRHTVCYRMNVNIRGRTTGKSRHTTQHARSDNGTHHKIPNVLPTSRLRAPKQKRYPACAHWDSRP